MRNFHTFPTVSHLHRLDKPFKNYKKTVRGTEQKIRDRKFTIAHPEVHGPVERSSDALFFGQKSYA